MNACPDQNILKQFIGGLLGKDEFDSIDIHVDSCADCQENLSELISDSAATSETDLRLGRSTHTNVHLPEDMVDRLVGKLVGIEFQEDGQSKQPVSEAIETDLGNYRVVREIGSGGMGVVYLAQQQEPVQRQVALKIIKLGRDTGEVLARFENERQALAVMDHPNIARVFDAGATDSGRPYFVMELVIGKSITELCDDRKLTTDERLCLFTDVCKAIQHAHQKGIIHRDIKPSNVLVSESDGKYIVKVIDFGLAKATEQRLTGNSFETHFTQILGTPLYMSPEQIDTACNDIDTRTDTYSLGVLLYELLTGCTPVDKQELQKASYHEIRRLICEVEPKKPSDLISSIDAAASEISSNRQSIPQRLSRCLRGDLDWIVIKALDKERDRRYQTANEFADDIDHYLNDEPVLASPPSRRYQLQKFVRRNRAVVTASSLVATALLLGAIGTTWGMIWTLSERDRANDAVLAEKVAKEEVIVLAEAETRAKEEAQQRADELEKVSGFQASQLSDIDANRMGLDLRNGLLDEVRSALERSKLESTEVDAHINELDKRLAGANFTNLSLRTLDLNIFQRAIAIIDEEFSDQPLVQASLLLSVGSTRHDLGLFDAATDPLERSLEIRRTTLGDKHVKTVDTIHDMGMLFADQGKAAEADACFREGLQASRGLYGNEHVKTLMFCNSLCALLTEQGMYSEAETIARQTLETARRTESSDSEKLAYITSLGRVLHLLGNRSEAEPLLREALAISRNERGDEHPKTLECINNLGALLHSQGKLSEAEIHFREAMQTGRRMLGDEHPVTLSYINNVAAALRSQGKHPEAVPLLRESLAASRRVLGDEHPGTLAAIDTLALSLQALGKPTEAEPLYREGWETSRRMLGEEHPTTMTSMGNLGSFLLSQDNLAEAEPLFRKTLEISRRTVGDDHPNTLVYINNLAALLKNQGKLAKAEPLYREALESNRRTLGDEHPNTLVYINNLAKLLKKLDNFPEAEQLYREAMETGRRVLGDDHPNTLVFIKNLASLAEDQGKLTEAESLFREVVDTARRVLGSEHPKTLSYIRKLNSLLRKQELGK